MEPGDIQRLASAVETLCTLLALRTEIQLTRDKQRTEQVDRLIAALKGLETGLSRGNR